MTERILQRGPNDCAVACLAMYMRVDYEEAFRRVQRYMHPNYDVVRDGMNAFWALSILAEHDDLSVVSPETHIYSPAIWFVEAPQGPGFAHAVYWDGREVYDPAPNGPYVTEQWAERYRFAQIQRVRDLAHILPSRHAALLRSAFAQSDQTSWAPKDLVAA